eukprot:210540_1
MSTDLNLSAIILFSSYTLLGCYLLILVCQRVTYTFKSPLSLILMRFTLLLMIFICCILTNLQYLYSCFVDTNTALTNTYYKYPFYIEFYFKNISWSLFVICMAYSIKFKRPSNAHSSLQHQHPRPHVYDAPPPVTPLVDQYIPQKGLHIDDVDLQIKPSKKHQKHKPSQNGKQHDDVDLPQMGNKYSEVDSKSSQSRSKSAWSSLRKPQTVFDNNRE